ncbi:MAG: PH domain-containing protein [Allosphingosinicella sp.]|uniref:PH domain-containing protein n=1 Tax=Allosphingosinicella sp. TaxID=2823234 RepID=UPI00392839D6
MDADRGGADDGQRRVAETAAAMTPLHPNQIWAMRIRAAMVAAALSAAAAALDMGPLRDLPAAPGPGIAAGAVAAIAFIAAFLLPIRRYRAWGYREEEDELHIASGLWIRLRTAVPFGRVQHIDVAQGPIERPLGLATLILHTAGTRGSAVALPGLPVAEAERMRDRIRAKIRQDLV